MNKKQIRLAALALAAFLFLLAGFGARKTITFSVDGESQKIETFAFTTGQFLRAAGVSIAAEDRVSPGLNHWLKNGDMISLDRAVPVVIYSDGEVYELVSAERIPADLIASVPLPFSRGDKLIYQGTEVDPKQPLPPSSSHHLQIVRGVALQVTVGSEAQSFSSTSSTLGQALWEQGIILRRADRSSQALRAPLSAGGSGNPSPVSIRIDPSRELTIQIRNVEFRLRSTAQTVGEALAEAGLSLQGLDYSLPAPDEPVPGDGRIRLVRVQERVVIEQSPIPFETEYQPVDDLELDQKEVVQAGEYGISARRIRIRYEDGQEIFRQEEGEWVAREPVNRIVGYGTRVVMHTITTSDGATINYWRALQMWATSYRPLETSNTTASGLPLQKGVAAVDTNYIPFGTRMYVPGYGEAIAADRGGGVKGRWIDLGYSNEDYTSWHQWVTVYFLWPPPENVVWIIP